MSKAVLRSIFAIAALLAVSSCSTAKRSTAPCKKGDGASFKTKTREEIEKDVLAAIARSDQKDLVRMASCDFLVGPTGSDNVGYNHPHHVMPLVLKSVKDLHWKKTGYSYGAQYNLPADSPDDYELIFRKDDGGWYWAGYATSIEAVYKPMFEGAYSFDEETR
jgi:hypothetical protein